MAIDKKPHEVVKDAVAINKSEDAVGAQHTAEQPHLQPEVELPEGAEVGKDVLVTPEGEVLELNVLGTMKIEPKGGQSKNANRLNSLKYGVAGMLYLLRREQSIQFASVVSVIVVIVGLWLEIGVFSWALLVLALGAIWITEALNTAIEASIDLGTSDPNVWAKIGKDVASTASLISSIVFVLIVILILVPRFLDRLSGS